MGERVGGFWRLLVPEGDWSGAAGALVCGVVVFCPFGVISGGVV